MGLRCGGGGEGCGDGPRLAPFRLGRARGGGRRLGGSGVRRVVQALLLLSRESACARRGCWAPAAEARRGPEQGQRAVLSWGRGRGPSCPASRRSKLPVRLFHLSTFAILKASCCRRSSACSRLSACFAARAALRRVRAFAARLRAPPACSERDSRYLGRLGYSLPAFQRGAVHAGRPGRVDADARVSVHPEPTAARQEREEALDGV